MNCNYSLIGLARPMLSCLFGFMVTCDGDLNMRANRLSLLSYPKGLANIRSVYSRKPRKINTIQMLHLLLAPPRPRSVTGFFG